MMKKTLLDGRWWVTLFVLFALFGATGLVLAQQPPEPPDDRAGPDQPGDEKGWWPPKPPDREMDRGAGQPVGPGGQSWQNRPPRIPRGPFGAGLRQPGQPGQGNFQPPVPPPEWESKVLAHLKENDPARFEEVGRIKIEKPMAYWEILRDAGRGMEQLQKIKERDPEEFKRRLRLGELKSKLLPLLKEYRALGDDAAKKKLELAESMKKLLDEEFELRQTSREARAARIESDLKKERERLVKRKMNKASLIDSHFKDLVGENDGLKW